MSALQLALFLLVAAGGTATVLTRDPLRQAFVFSVYGVVMTILFVVVEASDVALSELAVGTAATPLMLLAALASVRATDRKK